MGRMSEPDTPSPDNLPDADTETASVADARFRRGRAALSWVRHSPASRRVGRYAGVLAVALAGVILGVLVGGTTKHDLGPFSARFTISPNLTGDTQIAVPPLGSLLIDSHDGPAHLTIALGSLDQRRTEKLFTNPALLDQASTTALTDAERGIVGVVVQASLAALIGALVLGALVYRRPRRVIAVGVTALAVVVGTLGSAAATFRSDAIDEPRYEGLLVNAPAVVGDARQIASRYDKYREELQRLVTNVGKLYTTVSRLPVYEPDGSTLRVLEISDMHLNPGAWDVVRTVVQQFNIDLVVDTGDLTDWGTEREVATFAKNIASLKVPYVYIRGNHDSAVTARAVAAQRNAIVLENRVVTVDGLRIAGIGDPRFTPDKSSTPSDLREERVVTDAGSTLADTLTAAGGADVALVHDPLAATPLTDRVPLVLAGHTHKRSVSALSAQTMLLVEGSTGGAGLRGLEPSQPTPLALSVLYFGADHRLKAYDDITVGGTGRSEVTLQRRLVKPLPETAGQPSTGP